MLKQTFSYLEKLLPVHANTHKHNLLFPVWNAKGVYTFCVDKQQRCGYIFLPSASVVKLNALLGLLCKLVPLERAVTTSRCSRPGINPVTLAEVMLDGTITNVGSHSTSTHAELVSISLCVTLSLLLWVQFEKVELKVSLLLLLCGNTDIQ